MSALGGFLPPLVVELLAKTDEFHRKMDMAQSKLGAFSAEGMSMGELAGAGFMAVGAAAAAAIGISTKMAADYQQKLTELVTGAGESKANLQLVADGLQQMSVQVGTSSSQLADGMYMVESAGFHGAQGLDVMHAAAEGAKVGGADMATVANALTSALNAYRLPASAAVSVTDQLVATVASGKMHMQDLAGALGNVLPLANALHVPLSEVGGAMATMTAQGTDAATATTYLRFMLSSLSNPTTKAQKDLKSLGLASTSVADELTHKGLAAALNLITDHLSKKFPKGSAEYNAALANIVGGTRGMNAALELTGTHMKTFETNSKNIGDAAKHAGKDVEGWKEVQGDFNTQLDRVGAGLEAVAQKFGAQFLPAGTKSARMIADFTGQVLKDWPQITAAFERAWAPISGVFNNLHRGGSRFQAMLHDVSRGALQVWASVSHSFEDAWSHISPVLEQLRAHVAKWLTDNWPTIHKTLNAIATLVGKVFELIGAIIDDAVKLLVIVWDRWGSTFMDIAGRTLTWIWKFIGDFARWVGDLITVLTDLLEGKWGAAWSALQGMANDSLAVIRDALDAFSVAWSDVWEVVRKVLEDVWQSISGVLSSIGNAISSITSGIGSIASKAGGGLAHLLGFDEGGFVPGPIGKPMLAIVHGGEYVLTPDMQAGRTEAKGLTGATKSPANRWQGPGGTSTASTTPAVASPAPAGHTINVYAQTNADPHRIAAEIGWQLRMTA